VILSEEHFTQVRDGLGLPLFLFSGKPSLVERKPYQEPLDPLIAKHLNAWMETLRACLTMDPSQTATKRVQDMSNSVYEEGLTRLSAHTLGHFLADYGIDIAPEDAINVARGITKKMLLVTQGIVVDDFFSVEVRVEV
jgi:hypothetical protein